MIHLPEWLKRIMVGPIVTPVSPERMNELSDFFLEDFSFVEVREGGIFPRIFPYYAAIVFDQIINLRQGGQDRMQTPELQGEEFAHVVQWRRYGRLRFPFMYLYAHFFNGDGYDGNPYETSAKETATEFVDYCKRNEN